MPARRSLPACSFGRFIGLKEILYHLLDVRFFLQARVRPREEYGGDPCASPAKVFQDDRESLVVRQSDVVDHGEIVITDPELGVIRPEFAGILVPGLYLQPDLHLLLTVIDLLYHEHETS